MSASPDIAVIGADTLVGRELLRALATASFPVGTIAALAAGEAGDAIDFGDDELLLRPAAEFDYAQVALAFMVGDAVLAAREIPRALAAGILVVDATAASRADASVPLATAASHPDVLQTVRERGVALLPDPLATALGLALRPLQDAVGIERVTATTCVGVAGDGEAGIEALSAQSARALNGLGNDDGGVYPRPIAFNVLPDTEGVDPSGRSSRERVIGHDLQRLLEDGDVEVAATVLRVPVFHGATVTVDMQLCQSCNAAALTELLGGVDGLRLAPGDGIVTPMVDAVSTEHVIVSRIGTDQAGVSVSMWLVFDELRAGVAAAAVALAGKLLHDYL